MIKNIKYIIIGNGTAGLSSLYGIRKRDSKGPVHIISCEPSLAYSPTTLPYLIAGKITRDKVFIKERDFYQKMGASLDLNQRVLGINPAKREITLSGNKKLRYGSLLIATGSEPIMPHLGLKGSNDYSVLKTLEDARRLINKTHRKRDIAILGGGMIGMEMAYILKNKGFNVFVIEEKERILSSYFDKESEGIIRDIFIKNGVNILLSSKVTSIEKESKNQLFIYLQDGKKMRCEHLIIALGVKPAIGFLKKSGIRMRKGVIVDKWMRTNNKNIFAAGDVAETKDFFSKRSILSPLIPSAIEQGMIAGQNMAGGNETYEGNIRMHLFTFFGNEALSMGDVFASGKKIEIIKKSKPRKKRFYKLLLKDDCLIGALLINVDIKPGILQNLIKRRTNLSKWLESKREKSLNFGRIFQQAVCKYD